MGYIPKFEKETILRREMLVALRDNPSDFVQTLFAQHGEGIIAGFNTSLDDKSIIRISSGIVKIDGRIHVMKDEFCLEPKDGRRFVYLITEISDHANHMQNDLSIVMSEFEGYSDFELFRYFKDATLFEYTEFNEIENNITNRLDKSKCKYSYPGGSSLAPDYFSLFAAELLKKKGLGGFDYAFAAQCLVSAINMDLLSNYLKCESKINNSDLLCLLKKKVGSFSAKAEQPIEMEKSQITRPVNIHA